MMRRFPLASLPFLLLALLLPVDQPLAQLRYLVKPNLQPIVYISSVNYGTMPVGSDVNDGLSRSTPLLTCNQAMNSAGTNATLVFNGNPAARPTYICPAGIDRAQAFKGVDLTNSAIIAGVDTNKIFSVDVAAGQLVEFSYLTFDPSLGSGGAAARCIDLSSQSTTYSVTIYAVTFQNWSTNCINTPSASTKANVNIDTVTMNGGSVARSISLSTMIAGDIDVSNSNITVTAANAAGAGASIYIRSTAAGPTVNVTNTNTTTTFAAGVANQYFNVEIVDTPGAVIDGGTHTCTAPANVQCHNVGFQRVSATLGISRGIVRNVTAICDQAAGSQALCIYTSTDSIFTDPALAEDMVFEYNTATDVQNNAHVIFMNMGNRQIARYNTVVHGNDCLISKGLVNGEFYNNTINNCTFLYHVLKGSTNQSSHDNTFNATVGFAGTMYRAGVDSNTLVNSTGTATNNQFNNNGALLLPLVVVEAASTVTFATNAYNNNSGTVAAHPWNSGINYDTCVAWQAGPGTTDTCVGTP